MIFRLSQALSSKIKCGTLGGLPLDENPVADWSAHLFAAGRTQYIMMSNTQSLYSTVMLAKGVTTGDKFLERAVSAIREFLELDGRESVYRRLIEPGCESARFAKALNRSVTGSMNDLIRHAAHWLAEGEATPSNVGFRLNDVFLSSLARSKAMPYGKPRSAFDEMLNASNQSGEKPRSTGPDR
jgi:hypothetical protein